MENNQQPLHLRQQADKLQSVSSNTSYHPSKTFIILMVILLTLTVGIGGYILGANQNQIVQNQPQPAAPIIQPSPTSTIDPTADWKTYTNREGNYSIKYPFDWVFETYKEKYLYDLKYYKGHVVFQSRETTSKEKADDVPGLPVDMATGSIKIITTESMRGVNYANISEQDFFNPSNAFWPKGDAGGGGPGHTYSALEEVKIAEKKTIKQISHPTTTYEWVGPNQITTTYYIWLGNSANEVIEITLTYDENNLNKDILVNNFSQILSTFKFTDQP